MATPTPLRRPLLHLRLPHLQPPTHQRRTFFPPPLPFNPLSSASSTPQTLTATRTLPYPSAPIYSIVADVASYSAFLPYCTASSVTRWSAPDATFQRPWPSEASLTVGFAQFTETFTSRVFCVPGRIVESIGGGARTELPRAEIAHHLEGEGDGADADTGARGAAGGLMTHLRSRWTIEEVGRERTRVELSLEFAFANPVYMALSAGAAPRVAEVMVRAFEERVRGLMKRSPEMAGVGLGELEGSRVRR